MSDITKSNAVNGRIQSEESLPAWLRLVGDQVRSLKFGTVQITIHDSRVVQIERVEKLRFDKPEQNESKQ